MTKLIIGNGFNEAMIGDISKKQSLVFRQAVASEAKRLAWLLENGDVLISPSPVSRLMMEYIAQKMALDLDSITILPASNDINNPSTLTSDTLLNAEFVNHLSKLINTDNLWEVLPYFFTSSVIHLCGRLNIPILINDTNSFMSQGGAEILNNKAVFRAIAAGQNISLPPGNVCRTAKELYCAMIELLNSHGTIIVKQIMNGGGDGNIAVTLEDRPAYPGIRELFKLASYDEVTLDLATTLWNLLADGFGNNQLVIEAYLSSKQTLYAEYLISPDKSTYKRLSAGTVRMDKDGDRRGNGMVNWIGFEIPFQLPAHLSEMFFTQCDILASIVSTLGYSGRINFDAIYTDDEKVFFSEINGRLGGCTHIHFIAEKILGHNYLDTHYMLTRNRAATGDLKHAFKVADSLCSISRNSGALVLNEDVDTIGSIEYLVYAPTMNEAITIENEFQKLLHENG